MQLTPLEMRFQAQIDQALKEISRLEAHIGKAMSGIRKAVGLAAAGLAALGVSIGVSAFAGWVRQAIDAAEAVGKLGQKAGVATRDVAGLQLAFELAGVESGAMQTALAKLSVGITGGSKALEALGVQTRTATGGYRDTKDVLYEVADRFSGLRDGAAKTTVAVELFGRAGADLIPLLNGGSAGFLEMAEMAEKLGLVVDQETAESAGRFNDTLSLMGEAMRGIGTQLAAQLLPTLENLASVFLDAMTEGDGLRGVADFLATSFKILSTAAIHAVNAFSLVGRALGGVAAAVGAFISGEFSMAKTIWSDMSRDISEGVASYKAQIGSIWKEGGNQSVTALAQSRKALKELRLQSEAENAAAEKGAADAQAAQLARIKAADKEVVEARKAHFDEIAHLVKLGQRTELEAVDARLAYEEHAFRQRMAIAEQELALLRSKANSLKDQEGVYARMADIERGFTAAQRSAAMEIELLNKQAADALVARAEAASKAADAAEKSVQAAEREAQVLGVEYAHAAKGAGASNFELVKTLAELERAWAYETAAQIERRAEVFRTIDLSGATTEQLQREAAAVRELADLKFEGTMGRHAADTLRELNDYLDPSRPKDFAAALRDGFGEAGNALAQMANALQDYNQKQSELAKKQKALKDDESIGAAERAALQDRLARKSAELQIGAYASMTGAAKGFFKEHSRGYKAMEAVEKAFRAVEMAMAVQSMAKQLLGIGQVVAATVTGEATKEAAAAAGLGAQLAIDQAKGASAAAVGVATQAQGDPFTAWPRMAAMAAAMLALGFAVSGGGGGAGADAYTTPVAGTGTVLGSDEQSKSIGNAIELLAANSRIELPITQRMLHVMMSVRDGLAGLGVVISTNASLRMGAITPAVVNGGEVLDSGLSFSPQTVADILSRGFQGNSYTVSWQKKRGASASWNGLDASLLDPMNAIFAQMYAGVVDAARVLRLDDADMFNRLHALMPDLGDTAAMRGQGILGGGMVSLKGKSGKEAQDELEAMFSSLGDQMARAAMPSLAAFQQVGEGMLQTVMRVASDVEKAQYALERFGIAAIDYTQIVNKRGDVATEMVRQSVLVLETTATGALTGVGEILDLFTGSYDEFLDLYTALMDVRAAMRSVNVAGEALSVMMVRGAGGIENLQTGLQDYFEGYFSEQEQQAAHAARLAEEFARIGVAVPTSKEAFRALVDGLDTSTDAGAHLLGQLMALAGQFASVADAAEAAANAEAEAVWSTARSLADAWLSVANALSSDLDRLRADTAGLVDPALKRAQLLAQLDREVSSALGGDIDAARKVAASANTYLQAAERGSASRAEYLRDRALTEAKLAAVLEQAEEQASIQEVIAETGAAQILELRAINASLEDFARAVLAERRVAGDLPAFANGGFHAGGLRLVGERGPEIEATGASRIWNQAQLADAILGRDEDPAIWRQPSAGNEWRSLVERLTRRIDVLIDLTEQGNEEARTGDAAIAEVGVRTWRLLDRISEGGDALRTRDAASEDEAPSAQRTRARA